MPVTELFTAWKTWCEENNHRAGSQQTFGKDLRAVVPLLRQTQPRVGDQRERCYIGISLKSYTCNADRVPSRARRGSGTRWHA